MDDTGDGGGSFVGRRDQSIGHTLATFLKYPFILAREFTLRSNANILLTLLFRNANTDLQCMSFLANR